MYGEWWAKFKARRSCPHEWEAVKGYRTVDLEGDPLLGPLFARQENLFVYCCKLCGKKKCEREDA